jgi:ketosteroid isomerase-like protein
MVRVLDTENAGAIAQTIPTGWHGTIRPALGALVIVVCLLSNTALAAQDDPITALIRRQTDISSEAGQRGDQATVGKYLDDAVLFSAGDGNVQRDTNLDQNDALSTLLKQQTQAFRDASQRGDLATMRGYLDDQLLFINEDGVAFDRHDFAGGAPAAAPKGVPSTVTITDWVLHSSGNVAVSGFVNDQVTHYNGKTLNEKYLSVETWIKRGAQWKLIASETTPLHQDLPALTLPADAWNDYLGTYSAGPGSAVTITRDGNLLGVNINGTKAPSLAAEVRDIFYTPNLPPGYERPRIVFQRDAAGRVTGYVSRGLVFTKSAAAAQSGATPTPPPGPLVLRDFIVHHTDNVAVAIFFHDRDTPSYGQTMHQIYRSTETWIKRGTEWKLIASQGRQLMPDPPTMTLSAAALDDYAGTYAVGSELTVRITRAGNALAASFNGEESVPLYATVRDVFFTPGAPRIRLIFQRDANGRITGYLRRREERDLIFRKIA